MARSMFEAGFTVPRFNTRPLLRLWPAAFGLAVVLSAPAFALDPASTPAMPPAPRATRAAVPSSGAARAVRDAVALESGSGRILTLPQPAANVFVADPKVAEVRPASPNSLFVFGVGPGRTTIAAMDTDGHSVKEFEVTVRPSGFAASEAESMVARLMPGAHIRVSPQARGLLLTGSVANAADAARAVSILRGFMGREDPIENQLAVESATQVNLRVRIIEMNRSVTRALGVNWSEMSLGKTGIVSLASLTGLGAGLQAAGAVVASKTINAGGVTVGINALIQALAQDNLVRVLAEPNMTVMSGQPGSFLVGGEYPVPVGQQNGTITIDFKKYGVTLAVVPTVMSDGRINLHVAPEVSQLTNTGAVSLVSAGISLTIPALTVRRAETTVELGSGQTFAVAGLLQDQSTQTTNGIPLLGDIPGIGSLFRSSSIVRQETELVILVTPYIVKPVDNPASLHTPDERVSMPTDLERIWQLRQLGDKGVTQASASAPGMAPGGRIPGAAGFVVQ
jgi:pilus assembly protein CpaC